MKKIFLYALILKSILGISQSNVVPNPSFEDFVNCPYQLSGVTHTGDTLIYVTDWFAPTTGTPDYFNTCGIQYNIPTGILGYQKPKDGTGFCGLITLATNDTLSNAMEAREYLMTKLKDPLIAGETYCTSFYVSSCEYLHANYTPYTMAPKDIGMYFSKEPTNLLATGIPLGERLKVEPQINNDKLIGDTLNWTLVSGSFIADGGEQYLTIGSFHQDTTVHDWLVISPGSDMSNYPRYFSYLFIDVVTVIAQNHPTLFPEDYLACTTDFPLLIECDAYLDNFHWSTGDKTNVGILPDSGYYTVRAELNGCKLYDTLNITAIAPPIVDLGLNINACVDGKIEPVVLKNKVRLDNYFWSNYATSDSTIVYHPGKYRLVTNHLCGSFEDEIEVLDCSSTLYMPNVFMPTANSINDTFIPFGQNVELENLQVFNKQGVLLYQENNVTNGWDGTFRHQLCLPDVYLWKLTYKNFETPNSIVKYGDVTLIR